MDELTGLRELDLGRAAWRTSSYTAGNGNCIEVADGFAAVVPVRDSKDPGRAVLVFPVEGWAAFVASLKG